MRLDLDTLVWTRGAAFPVSMLEGNAEMSGVRLAARRFVVRLAGKANGEGERGDMNGKPEQAAPDQTVDDVIANCDGDPRVAVAELLAIIRSLIHENQTLRVDRRGLRAAAPSCLDGRNSPKQASPVRPYSRQTGCTFSV
jgi:hypothetical protein